MKAHYLVCFDISDDRIRQRVCKLLLRHGSRVQESVFELAFSSEHLLQKLRKQLRGVLDEECELRFYRLCLDCRKGSSRIDGMPVAALPSAVII